MKRLALLCAIGLVGCATRPTNYQPAWTYQRIESIQVHDSDCPNIDNIITQVNDQLIRRGTFGKNPEDLNEQDRKFNERGHVIIWSLRIGCNNPNRYSKK